jgi:inhibitor of KinA
VQDFRIYPIHDHALTVEFSKNISEADNARVLALRDAIEQKPFKGLLDIVPAYSSIAIFYDTGCMRDVVISYLQERIQFSTQLLNDRSSDKIIQIPVCYDPSFGIDQEFVCDHLQLSREQLIEQHTGNIYRVYMIGFIPGFPYMGILPEGWKIPRKQTPALKIPAGSVALAGQQTGIYPTEVPGGWQVIGRTPLKIFDALRDPSCLLKAGDQVKFESISLNEFNSLS